MSDPDFIAFLKTLKPENWGKMATSKWTVKDVVAHMVGWERGDVEAIKTSWETKEQPWWKSKVYEDAPRHQKGSPLRLARVTLFTLP